MTYRRLFRVSWLGLMVTLCGTGFSETFTDVPVKVNSARAASASLEPKIASTSMAGPIVVAVIDTGLNTRHPELRGKLWVNGGETGRDAAGRDKSSNGVDDDQNGFVDDVHGWDFVKNTPDIEDDHGHGTHVAGIIAGQSTGVAPEARLMVLKYYDSQIFGASPLEKTVQAIRYAVKMGAHVINYSGGGLEPNPEERAAIIEAARGEILFVAAAGNENTDTDEVPFFPAGYGLANILSVGALDDSQTQTLRGTNFGLRTVDLAAPGRNIRSAGLGKDYLVLSGTSQATAFVSGAAARVLQELGANQPATLVKTRLMGTGLYQDALRTKTRHQSKLNYSRLDKDFSLSQDPQGRLTSNGAGIPETLVRAFED